MLLAATDNVMFLISVPRHSKHEVRACLCFDAAG